MFLFDHNEIIKRLKKYPVLKNFSEFALRKLVIHSETLELAANQALFHVEDPSDSVYYLIEGHLAGYSSNNFQRRVVDIHRGEMIGEMGVISGESRGLAVKSSGVSQVLKIDKDVFLNFFQKDPERLMILTQTVTRRLRRVIMGLQDEHYPYKNIGCVVLSEGIDVQAMQTVFQRYALADNVHIWTKSDMEASKLDIISFFYQCEENSGINIFIAEYGEENWNIAILDNVDYVYLIAQEGEWNRLNPDKMLELRNKPTDIIILHSEDGPYKNTAEFYDKYRFKRHHHILPKTADYQRIYRYMTGQAIGLVLSGGGFRGYVHYGLLKALFEAKIPIDCIGGTSMGGAIGAILALRRDWDYFDSILNTSMGLLKKTRLVQHITLPLCSLLSGEVSTHVIKNIFESYQIEDLATNFFCVVGNLSKTRKEIKKRGKLWEWIRATTAIPGLLPPFEKNGLVYVDGGVCANLPIQDMRRYLNNAGKVIAFNVHTRPFHKKEFHFPPILRFRDALKYKFGRNKHQYVLPNFTDVIMESTFINQYMHNMKEMSKADIILSPDTSDFNAYRIKHSSSMHMFAYELAQEKLKEYKSVYERWVLE